MAKQFRSISAAVFVLSAAAGTLVFGQISAACDVPDSIDSATRFPAAPRIVAIGDLHGDLDATRRVLRMAGAIDNEDSWIGGRLVVVQTGDQLDRGDDEQAVLDLLERLAEEAVAAGGAVHVLNGNHEIMNGALDLRYVTAGGFADFEDAVAFAADDTVLAQHPPEHRARVAAFRPGGPYARVLAERSTVIIVGDNVFVHGGVLPEHLDYGLERMNAEIRAWLAGDAAEPSWIHTKDSIVWTRRYSDEPDSASCEMLGAVLERLGAARMIVGHTVQEEGITTHCDGHVWCIDVGISAHYGGEAAVLEIVGDSVHVLREESVPAPAH